MELTSFDLTTMDWYYRGEGNLNLVLALRPNHILRISKTDNADNEYADKSNHKKFITFITPFVSDFIQEYQIVFLKKIDTEKIENQLNKYRPVNRLKNKKLQYGEAYICFDYTNLPENLKSSLDDDVFCVELKLKQGWVPPIDQILLPLCPFCLHQYYKLKTNQVSNRSKYCPLNIYSGNRLRMQHAIETLIKSPQNNFKLFKNGEIVFSDNDSEEKLNSILKIIFEDKGSSNSKLQEYLSEILINMLLKNYSSHKNPDICSKSFVLNSKCSYLPENHQLPNGSVLEILFKLQKFDKIGLAAAYFYYNQLLETYCENVEQWNIINLTTCADIDNNVRSKLKDYLIFATFRDCSLMLTFQKNSNNIKSNHLISISNGMQFQTNIGITDLDPKSLKSIKKHFIQTNSALNYYKEIDKTNN